MTVTLDKFGRVLIPKPLRDQLGIEPGTELSLDVHAGDGGPMLEIRQVPHGDDALVREGSLLVHDGRPTGTLDVAAILREQRDDRARRHAGLNPDAR